MKKNKMVKKNFESTLQLAREALVNGITVRVGVDMKKGVIEKIDPDNMEFTILVRLKDGTLKWVSFDQVWFNVEEDTPEDEAS